MRTSEKKIRFNGTIPVTLYNRLDEDSKKYGINKIDIVTTALAEYYKFLDIRINSLNRNL